MFWLSWTPIIWESHWRHISRPCFAFHCLRITNFVRFKVHFRFAGGANSVVRYWAYEHARHLSISQKYLPSSLLAIIIARSVFSSTLYPLQKSNHVYALSSGLLRTSHNNRGTFQALSSRLDIVDGLKTIYMILILCHMNWFRFG